VLVESLGQVQPVRPTVIDQLLFPAPRAFLSTAAEARLAGAQATLRYLGGQREAVRLARSASVLHHAMPYVVHAFFEASMPSGVDQGAASVRLEEMTLPGRAAPSPIPAAADCARLLDLAVVVAVESSAPPVAIAGWLAFMVLTIHPFSDGNGRVCRSMYLAAQDADPEVGLDTGVTEQWGLDPAGYIAAIDAGWTSGRWDPATIDPTPFMTFAAHASLVGAELGLRRRTVLAEYFDRAVGRGVSEGSAALLLGVALLRVAVVAELAPLEFGTTTNSTIERAIESAIDDGLLEWSPRPASRRTMAHPDATGLVLSARGRSMLE
jgi:hypothetical protein